MEFEHNVLRQNKMERREWEHHIQHNDSLQPGGMA